MKRAAITVWRYAVLVAVLTFLAVWCLRIGERRGSDIERTSQYESGENAAVVTPALP